jgi:hypothetical protein
VDLIEAALKAREGKRLTARMLAEVIVIDNSAWAEKKRQNSINPLVRDGGEAEMVAQVQSEIGSNKPSIERRSTLRMTEDRPRRYYFTSLSEEEEVEAAEEVSQSASETAFSEHDLYPKLARYLLDEHGVYAKRIEEKKSKNRNGPQGNQWLHPDLIGFEPLSEKWSDSVRQLVNSRSDPETLLWSFEVKKLVNRSNVRKVFFQALSNSAWANFGYLVAAEISGNGTLEELRMLSAQHGIGVVQLSTSDDIESAILIQAQSKPLVDWTAANRLCEENPDADEVFRQVRVYHQSGEMNHQFWDAS